MLAAAYYLEGKYVNDKDSWANDIFRPFVREIAEGFTYEGLNVQLKDQNVIQINPCNPSMEDPSMKIQEIVIGVSF